jgi:hypothetical protein
MSQFPSCDDRQGSRTLQRRQPHWPPLLAENLAVNWGLSGHFGATEDTQHCRKPREKRGFKRHGRQPVELGVRRKTIIANRHHPEKGSGPQDARVASNVNLPQRTLIIAYREAAEYGADRATAQDNATHSSIKSRQTIPHTIENEICSLRRMLINLSRITFLGPGCRSRQHPLGAALCV